MSFRLHSVWPSLYRNFHEVKIQSLAHWHLPHLTTLAPALLQGKAFLFNLCAAAPLILHTDTHRHTRTHTVLEELPPKISVLDVVRPELHKPWTLRGKVLAFSRAWMSLMKERNIKVRVARMWWMRGALCTQRLEKDSGDCVMKGLVPTVGNLGLILSVVGNYWGLKMEEWHDQSKFLKDHLDIIWDGLGKGKPQVASCTSPGERWSGLDKGVRNRFEHGSVRLWNRVKVELKVLLMDWMWD